MTFIAIKWLIYSLRELKDQDNAGEQNWFFNVHILDEKCRFEKSFKLFLAFSLIYFQNLLVLRNGTKFFASAVPETA